MSGFVRISLEVRVLSPGRPAPEDHEGDALRVEELQQAGGGVVNRLWGRSIA